MKADSIRLSSKPHEYISLMFLGFKMFKHKSDDLPKSMTMMEIQEDLATFNKANIKTNCSILVEDLKQKDFVLSSANQWIQTFDVNNIQVSLLSSFDLELNELKRQICENKILLENREQDLLKEIECNLSRLRLLKAPKE
jgi:hypothetical protein